MIWLFSKNIWRIFGQRLLATLYRRSNVRYNFGFGYNDPKLVCKYYKSESTRAYLQNLITTHKLKGKNDFETVKAIMKWVNKTYPSKLFYKSDDGDRWNNPVDTIESWKIRTEVMESNPGRSMLYYSRLNDWKNAMSTDCDDYAIVMYNMCRVAGVDYDDMYLTFMKTSGEWHMNMMYFDDNIPYAVEGTYWPENAEKNFGVRPYFHSKNWNGNWKYYYRYIKWYWNEKKLFVNNNRVNKL